MQFALRDLHVTVNEDILTHLSIYRSTIESWAISHMYDYRGKASSQLLEEEKKAFFKLEAEFLEERSQMFCLMLQNLSPQLVAAGVVKDEWGSEIESYSKETFSKAKQRSQSVHMSNMTRNEMKIPDILQIDRVSTTVLILAFIVIWKNGRGLEVVALSPPFSITTATKPFHQP